MRDSEYFCLKLRHGGKIHHIIPPKYVGGKVQCFADMDPDEWGFMTLMEKVYELGYHKNDNIRVFSKNEHGLLEVHTDADTSFLVNYVVRPKEVEIWVVLEGVGEVENAYNNVENAYNNVENTDNNDEDCDSDWENEDSYLGNDEHRVDDVDFVKYTDPNVEYGGYRAKDDALLIPEPVFVDIEVNFSDSEDDIEGIVNEERVGENVRDANTTPTPVGPSPLWLGRIFHSKGKFKDAVKSYGIQFGKQIHLIYDDKVRCIGKCVHDGCKWKVTCRFNPDEQSWMVTAFNDKHADCPWVRENKMVTASLVAKRWKNRIAQNMDWKMEDFRKAVCTDDYHDLTKRQAYKALTMAKKEIKGELEDNFNKIWRYIDEIHKRNPNTTCATKLSDLTYEGGKKRLLRVYICWESCREGFKHCRKLIGVDGCHLRGKAGGMMLTAIGVDANDSIFPIAYAIVEGENKDSWCWFLQLLRMDLKINYIGQQNYTFMSDKQKGLIPAFEQVLPLVTHRYCVRHLHGNMKVAGHGGLPIKNALWKAARATTVSTFAEAMSELRALDICAFQWLSDKHPSEWSRSHFTSDATCDMLVNNICESFNAKILDARDSPLINCLEIVRKQVMVRLFECRKQATKWSGPICPGILKKLSVSEKQAACYWGYQCDDDLFEVTRGTEQHQVDLRAKACSCRQWDLTGIPCRHAICAIWLKIGKPPIYEYVNSCYTVESYVKIYSGSIYPMAGPSEWPINSRQPPLPPLVTVKVGRPTKLRKKSAGELTKNGVYVSRKHVPLHCKLCRQKGHNIRKCPLKPRTAIRVQNNQIEGGPITQPVEMPIHTQPDYFSDFEGLPVEIQVENEHEIPYNNLEIPVEMADVQPIEIE